MSKTVLGDAYELSIRFTAEMLSGLAGTGWSPGPGPAGRGAMDFCARPETAISRENRDVMSVFLICDSDAVIAGIQDDAAGDYKKRRGKVNIFPRIRWMPKERNS
jgi:hypothetical protein